MSGTKRADNEIDEGGPWWVGHMRSYITEARAEIKDARAKVNDQMDRIEASLDDVIIFLDEYGVDNSAGFEPPSETALKVGRQHGLEATIAHFKKLTKNRNEKA